MYNQKTRSLTQRYIQRATVSVQQWLNSVSSSRRRCNGKLGISISRSQITRFENLFESMDVFIQIRRDLLQDPRINVEIICINFSTNGCSSVSILVLCWALFIV